MRFRILEYRGLNLAALCAAFLMLAGAPAGQALADVYAQGGASLANAADMDPDTDDLGFLVEAGVTDGTLDAGLEVSNFCNAGDCTAAAAFNARAAFGDWAIRPYLEAGIGIDTDSSPLLQAGAGLRYQASDGFAIYAGARLRAHFEDIGDIGDLGNYGDNDEVLAVAGVRLAF